MKLTPETAREIVWGDHEDWTQEGVTEYDGNSRWSKFCKGVFLHGPTGKFYAFNWSVGATECQEEGPYENDKEVDVCEVVKKQIMTEQWVGVEDGS